MRKMPKMPRMQRMQRMQRTVYPAALAAAFLALAASPALASENGFTNGQISVHLGVFEPRGESDLWDFNEELTTQDISDFDDAIGGVTFGTPIGRHADVQFGLSYYDARADVRYRDIFTVDGDTISQHHRLRMAPLEVSFRVLPIARETRDGDVRPVVPYLGGGAGGMLWSYREKGFFADDVNNPTFVAFDKREARGVTGTLHALAGVEIQFTHEASIFFEGRYRWAKDDLGSDFDQDLDRFDLSGATLSVGFTYRFGEHGHRRHRHRDDRDDRDGRDDRGHGDDDEDD